MYVFLDIDGVLNNEKSNLRYVRRHPDDFWGGSYFVRRRQAHMLFEVLAPYKPKVVISSSWQVGGSISRIMLYLQHHGVSNTHRLNWHGMTNEVKRQCAISCTRTAQIYSYMLEHGIYSDQVVIIDDTPVTGFLAERAVKVSGRVGISAENCRQLRKMLTPRRRWIGV